MQFVKELDMWKTILLRQRWMITKLIIFNNNIFTNCSAYSRSLTTLNFGCNLKRDLNKLMVLHTMEYKYGTIFRSVVRTPSTDFCVIMNGGDGNPIFKMMIEVIKDSVPGLFHPCPYKLSIRTFTWNILPNLWNCRVHFPITTSQWRTINSSQFFQAAIIGLIFYWVTTLTTKSWNLLSTCLWNLQTKILSKNFKYERCLFLIKQNFLVI